MPLNNLHTINVWDVLIRIFHWSHVGFFTLAYLTEGEDEWMTIHSYAGYSILILHASASESVLAYSYSINQD
ncbi:MAG: cytochrome b [Shewanella psychromarinicola]|jgi:cytochrome b